MPTSWADWRRDSFKFGFPARIVRPQWPWEITREDSSHLFKNLCNLQGLPCSSNLCLALAWQRELPAVVFLEVMVSTRGQQICHLRWSIWGFKPRAHSPPPLPSWRGDGLQVGHSCERQGVLRGAILRSWSIHLSSLSFWLHFSQKEFKIFILQGHYDTLVSWIWSIFHRLIY